MFFDEMENTFTVFAHISQKKGGRWGGGMGVHGPQEDLSKWETELFSSLPPFPFWDIPPPTLKLPTWKGYVGICREINIWFFALEKQLERR